MGAGTVTARWAVKADCAADPRRLVAFVIPLPDKLTCCGLSVLPSAIERFAVSSPSVVGLNITVIVQEAPAATLAGTYWSEKSCPDSYRRL